MKSFVNCSILFLILSSLSCKEDPLGEGKAIPPVITWVSSGTEDYWANGSSVYSFKAKVDPKVKSEYKNIVFSCTIGSIVLANSDGTRTITIDETGEAEITWKTSDEPGEGVIKASIGGGSALTFFKEIPVKVQKIERTLDFKIENEVKEVKADNKSIITLRVSIPNTLPEKYRKITFKCSMGSFTGTGDANSREVIVSENGEASLQWKVGGTTGKAFFSAEISGVLNSKAEKVLDVLEADPPSFIMTLSNYENAVVDGLSVVKIKISEAKNIPDNKIKLIASGGTILDAVGSAIIDNHLILSNGEGIAYLRMGTKVERYFLKAQTTKGDLVRNFDFMANRAYANKMFTEVQKNGNDYSISVYLRRDTGKVSSETPVTFEAYQLMNNLPQTSGNFKGLQNAKTDENDQKVTITYNPDNNLKQGSDIFIRITTPKDSLGDVLTELVTILPLP